MENETSNMSVTENNDVTNNLGISWADDEDEHSHFKFEAKSVNFDLKHEFKHEGNESSESFQAQIKTEDLECEDGEYEYGKSINFNFKNEENDSRNSEPFQGLIKTEDLKCEDGEYEYEDGEVITPQKGSKSPFKSAKSLSVYKKRDNPYAKAAATTTGETVFDRLGPKACEKKVDKKRKAEEPKRESDPAVLDRRQKQIDYGKNTLGYDRYRQLVPKDKRTPEDPVTPNKYGIYPRRGFDGLIKLWRLKLHKYDPPSDD